MRLVPSESPVKAAPIVDFFILTIFNSLSNHYCCVSGYDKTSGAFYSELYRDVILGISGVDLADTVTPAQSLVVYEAISTVIADVKTHKWLRHYFHKYPESKHNFPIEIYNHVTTAAPDLYVSSCELEFLQTLFKTYADYRLFLIPLSDSVQ